MTGGNENTVAGKKTGGNENTVAGKKTGGSVNTVGGNNPLCASTWQSVLSLVNTHHLQLSISYIPRLSMRCPTANG